MKWFRRDKRERRKVKREERVRKRLAKAELAYLELLAAQLSVENEMLGASFDLDKKRSRSYIA